MNINLLDDGIQDILFYSFSDLLLAKGYNRIEYGKRGPYIEFSFENIVLESFYIPKKESWRIRSELAYYIEFRSKCDSYVKLYLQKRPVHYAKYEIDKFYISPLDLKTNKYGNCVGETKFTTLFF